MKRLLIVVVVCALGLAAPGYLASQEKEILCCRFICNCGPDSLMCDYQSLDQCRALDGWEVSDCGQCDN